jgi:uncharacterized protein YlzI (FlbEa/FlbD family)
MIRYGILFFAIVICFTSNANATSAKWFREMIKKEHVSQGDCILGITYVVSGREADCNYKNSLKLLRAKKIIPSKWRLKRNNIADKAFLSMLVYNTLNLKGGLKARLFGVNARTAYQEVADMKIIPANGEKTLLSGGELLAVLNKIVEYKKKISTKGVRQ